MINPANIIIGRIYLYYVINIQIANPKRRQLSHLIIFQNQSEYQAPESPKP